MTVQEKETLRARIAADYDWRQIAGQTLAVSARNRALAAELGELLRLFEESGIRALPFKGPVLALDLFGDLALREFVDLDILVPAGEILRATDLIEARGYEPLYRVGRARLDARQAHALRSPARSPGEGRDGRAALGY